MIKNGMFRLLKRKAAVGDFSLFFWVNNHHERIYLERITG